MKGTNEIIFCQAQMNEAIEKYLEEHFIKDRPVKVVSVGHSIKENCPQFTIVLKGITTDE